MSIASALLSDEKKIRIVPTGFNTQPTQANYMFMRPNMSNGGYVPASSPYCESPDIWLAGTQAVNNYQTVLATQDSYNQSSSSNLYLDQSNYFYVRGCNGSATDTSVSVTLYYSPSSMIQDPSRWQNNIIKTDQGENSANIFNQPSGTVGVADATFFWPQVPPPGNGTGHYCLITQFNDARNSNPFPSIYSPLDLGKLIQNNLMWGWRNTNMMNPDSSLQWSYYTDLTIGANLGNGYYSINVSPVGFIGWQVSFECSQTDSKGNRIFLAKTNISQDNLNLGINNVYLEGGYSAQVTVYMYNPNGLPLQDGCTAPITASYLTNGEAEYQEAVRHGLIDWRLTRTHKQEQGMPIQAYVAVGAVTGLMK